MAATSVPAVVARVVATRITLHGDAGAAWAARLPAIIAASAERWSLDLGDPFPGLIFNYVSPARLTDGTEVVLKVCFPDRELETEIAALRVYGGDGAARLLAADEDSGALLLEGLTGDRSLDDLDDDAATAVLAAAMERLWRPVPEEHRFPGIADWLEELAPTGEPELPAAISELALAAQQLADGLRKSSARNVLLHGDLHHGNVLAAERLPWLAIDPKGVMGEPACDAAAMLRNRIPAGLDSTALGRLLDRRLSILAEALGIDRRRLRDWGIVLNTLSLMWSLHLEDAIDESTHAVVESLAQL